MADLATVRAEIKTWEKTFKESSGRAPTVDDIKKNNDIADKYKLYKRLSKAAAPSNASQKDRTAPRLSTPPRTTRPKDPTSVLFSKSRAVQPTAPLAAFNPFSPQKKQKGKERERNIMDKIETPRANLFGKPQPRLRSQQRSPSPDMFPLIHPSQGSSATSSSSNFNLALGPVPTSAVSRARKRLRGEPVSPSPNKEKRRRVVSKASLSFPRLNLDSPSSDAEFEAQDADSSFVDNSPVKAPTSGKLFTQLFDETLAPVDLFGVKSNLGLMDVDDDEPTKPRRKVAQTTRVPAPSRRNTKPTRSEAIEAALGPTKHRNIAKLPTATHRNSNGAPSESSSRSSTKRPVSEDEVDEIDQQPIPRSRSPLIPPSPPASGASSARQGKYASKAKGAAQSRKKAKVEEQATDDSDGLELSAKLKIVTRNPTRVQRAAAGAEDEEDMGFDSDPVLGYPRFAQPPRAPSPNATQHEEDLVEVDLPDELRRVLALQTSAPKGQLSEEDRLVKGLLYGRRTTHYDASKGGEIWDVGEDHHVGSDDEANRDTGGEDDWEGEPVPWEVGEL